MSTVIDQKDLDLIDKNIERREKILSNIFSDETKLSDARVVRLALLALDSMDNTIVQKAKIKIEDKSASDQNEIKEAMAQALIELHKQKELNARKVNDTPRALVLDDNVAYDLLPHETSTQTEQLTLDTFLENYKNAQ